MGFFRFRRSIKLLPGVRWNIGKKSTSLSIGPRGAHYTVGTAGSRTTVGIPGTGLSYTDIHRTHSAVSNHSQYAGVPTPSKEWVDSHQVKAELNPPDRQPGEAPIRPDQIETIKEITKSMEWEKVQALGEHQADYLIEHLREMRKEYSKKLLKEFYAGHGHAVSDAFIDHCYDHPDQPYQAPKKWGCFSILIAIIAIYLFIMAMIGIVQQNLK
jgi:Protein of unknown function (DUF4236)